MIKDNGKFLITKRLENSPMGHCWEFPGGKIEPGETIEECIIRECQEEIAVTITPLKRLRDEWYDYPHGRIHLHFVLCEITEGKPKPVQCREIKWIKDKEFVNYEFPPADVRVIKDLLSAPPPLGGRGGREVREA